MESIRCRHNNDIKPVRSSNRPRDHTGRGKASARLHPTQQQEETRQMVALHWQTRHTTVNSQTVTQQQQTSTNVNLVRIRSLDLTPHVDLDEFQKTHLWLHYHKELRSSFYVKLITETDRHRVKHNLLGTYVMHHQIQFLINKYNLILVKQMSRSY